jgi:antitoxin Phd
LQDAKNRFIAVLDAALAGEPQKATRRGRWVGVVISADQYKRLRRLDQANAPTLPELLLALSQDDEGFERMGADASRVSVYLIDTMVLSELRHRQRDAGVVVWISKQRQSDCFLSVVTIGEIERGIAARRSADPAFAGEPTDWLDRLLRLHGERPPSATTPPTC